MGRSFKQDPLLFYPRALDIWQYFSARVDTLPDGVFEAFRRFSADFDDSCRGHFRSFCMINPFRECFGFCQSNGSRRCLIHDGTRLADQRLDFPAMGIEFTQAAQALACALVVANRPAGPGQGYEIFGRFTRGIL